MQCIQYGMHEPNIYKPFSLILISLSNSESNHSHNHEECYTQTEPVSKLNYIAIFQVHSTTIYFSLLAHLIWNHPSDICISRASLLWNRTPTMDRNRSLFYSLREENHDRNKSPSSQPYFIPTIPKLLKWLFLEGLSCRALKEILCYLGLVLEICVPWLKCSEICVPWLKHSSCRDFDGGGMLLYLFLHNSYGKSLFFILYNNFPKFIGC